MAATAGYPEAYRRQVAELDRAMRALAEAFNGLVEAVRRAGPVGGAWPAGRLPELRETVAGLADRARQVVRRDAAVLALMSAGASWSGPVADGADAVRTGLAGDIVSWQSRAGDAYRRRLRTQRDAVDDVRTDAETVGRYLGVLSAGTATYVGDLLAAVADLAGSIGRAVAARPAALDLPGVIDELAGAARRAVADLRVIEDRLRESLPPPPAARTHTWPTPTT